MNELIPLSEAVSLFPSRTGKPITIATLRYRIKKGCRGVKLRGFLSGGTWFTTKEAVDQFHAELQTRAMPGGKPLPRKTSKAAKDYLKRLGINAKGDEESKAKGKAAAR